jgi:hypothetical protein
MATAQPLNSTISVYLNVRSFRQFNRYESIAAIIKRLRPLTMMVPGEEQLVTTLARDTSVSDFSPYCGEARYGASRGFPIVIGLTTPVTFASAQANLTAIDFAFQIGQDKFLANTTAGITTQDLQADLRAL